jgi:hypothetical protein
VIARYTPPGVTDGCSDTRDIALCSVSVLPPCAGDIVALSATLARLAVAILGVGLATVRMLAARAASPAGGDATGALGDAAGALKKRSSDACLAFLGVDPGGKAPVLEGPAWVS